MIRQWRRAMLPNTDGGELDGGAGGAGAGASKANDGAAVQAKIDAAAAAARRATEARLATEHEAALKTARETHARELETWQAKERGWSEERTILGAGIRDADGVELARHAWSRVPTEQRPEGGLAEWLKSESVPIGVTAYLPPAEGTTQSTTKTVVQHPLANKGATSGAPGGPALLTPEQIAALSDEDFLKIKGDLLAGRR
jgi:hypothetical protein